MIGQIALVKHSYKSRSNQNRQHHKQIGLGEYIKNRRNRESLRNSLNRCLRMNTRDEKADAPVEYA